ncbi:helix-turn-helix transcriptional regulator [Pannonibacter sp. Pt2]|uniref:Helix-turn-helix transcriptional regulator n=1 Tax=Pannonibacter anstelovis TaxID=3121537 RepID=A0ABU7ZJL6_9HYPH
MDANGGKRIFGGACPEDAAAAFNHTLDTVFDAVLEPARWAEVCAALEQHLEAQLLLMTFGPDGRHDARFCDRSTAEPMLIHLARSQVESGKSIIAYMLHDAGLLTYHCKRKIICPALKPELEPSPARDDLRYTKALMTRVYEKDGHKALLVACRSASQPSFDVQEFHFVDLLSKRLNIALECASRIREARLEAEQAALLSNSGSHLSMLMDPMRRIIASRGPALEELGLNQILEVRNGRLNILSRELEDLFEPMVEKMAPGLLLGSIRPDRRQTEMNGSQELVIITESGTPCRIELELSRQDGQEGPAQLVIRIHLPRGIPAGINTALQSVYGLSRSEARLVQLLVASGSLTETLDTLSVTRNTAKTHLRRIYEKTGTRSQLELAQTVYRLASIYC